MDPKELENQTPPADGLGGEQKPEVGDGTPKTETPEEVLLTPEEIAKLKKKAADFDGLVERQRLEKLKSREDKTPSDNSELQEKINQIQSELQSIKVEKANDNLTDAFREFKKEIPWAIEDKYFDEISKDFSADGVTKKEELVSKLRALTISKFPNEYAAHKEKEIKAKALAEAALINAGAGGGASNNELGKGGEKIDPLEKLKQKYNASLPKGYTAIKK